jgi:hypothetical protein
MTGGMPIEPTGSAEMTRKATNDEWTRYYAETARRDQHGRNDPTQHRRARALNRERLGIAVGLAALAAALLAYLGLLGG